MPTMIYIARSSEYGDVRYERGNFARPTGGERHDDPTPDDFRRFRAYLRANVSHAMLTLEAMEDHLATDPDLEDMDGAIAACFAPDTDVPERGDVGPSFLPHVAMAVSSLNMALKQATDCGLLPLDPGQPWKTSGWKRDARQASMAQNFGTPGPGYVDSPHHEDVQASQTGTCVDCGRHDRVLNPYALDNYCEDYWGCEAAIDAAAGGGSVPREDDVPSRHLDGWTGPDDPADEHVDPWAAVCKAVRDANPHVKFYRGLDEIIADFGSDSAAYREAAAAFAKPFPPLKDVDVTLPPITGSFGTPGLASELARRNETPEHWAQMPPEAVFKPVVLDEPHAPPVVDTVTGECPDTGVTVTMDRHADGAVTVIAETPATRCWVHGREPSTGCWECAKFEGWCPACRGEGKRLVDYRGMAAYDTCRACGGTGEKT
jgi:hypothetical protein